MSAAMTAAGASLARPRPDGRYPGVPLPVRGGEAGGVRVRRADALSGSPFHYALVACPEPARDLNSGPGPDPGQLRVPAGSGIVALASCRAVDEGAAELGILIEDAWQRRGLGTRLIGDLAAHAANAGVRVLEAQLLAEQSWITRLLRPYGACRLCSTWNGVLDVSVRLPASTGRRGRPPGAALTRGGTSQLSTWGDSVLVRLSSKK